MKIYHRAFSLIELSIVVLIIGILVAGVTISSRLVNQMRLTSARSLTLSSPVSAISDLSLWYESTSPKSFDSETPSNGEYIAKWYDLNPRRLEKLDLGQTGADNLKPIYETNAINGLPALRFNGGQFLERVNTLGGDFTQADQISIFFVQNHRANILYSSTLSWVLSSSGIETSRLNIHAGSSDNIVHFDFGPCCPTASRSSSIITNSFFGKTNIISFIKNNTTTTTRINNIVNGVNNSSSSSLSTSSSSSFTIGRFTGDASYSLSGLFGELIIFSRALKEDERLDVERYLAKKWGIKI